MRAGQMIAIISAKYGVVRPLDEIEPYKQEINRAAMREGVSAHLSAIKTDLIIDCRSSTYKGVWAPPHHNCVEIKVFTLVDGVKKVITHMSKKSRGELRCLLLESPTIPTNPRELQIIVSSVLECHLIPAGENEPWTLEVIC